MYTAPKEDLALHSAPDATVQSSREGIDITHLSRKNTCGAHKVSS
jgi:hypothetical protein